MKAKLEILMADTGLRVGEIAAKLGVKAPVISHILKGRNQPNFALTAKIISTFNQYNPYWWLGTSDVKMAISPIATPSEETSPQIATVTTNSSTDESPSLFDHITQSPQPQVTPSNSSLQVERVIVIYSDKSFETFHPHK